jgi:hypothetical protein
MDLLGLTTLADAMVAAHTVGQTALFNFNEHSVPVKINSRIFITNIMEQVILQTLTMTTMMLY